VENENTFGAIGWCLEPHDLAVSKLIAGREKDFDFVGVMVAAKIVSATVIQERIKGTVADPFLLQRASGWVERLSQAGP
jgi:hypothetical protein